MTDFTHAAVAVFADGAGAAGPLASDVGACVAAGDVSIALAITLGDAPVAVEVRFRAGAGEDAERVRALDAHAEGTLAGMLKRSKVAEHNGHASDQEMIKAMLVAQETLAATLAGTGALAAEQAALVSFATHYILLWCHWSCRSQASSNCLEQSHWW